MKIIVRPRQMGKTSELIRLAEKKDGVIVCLKMDTAKNIDRLAMKMGIKIRPSTTYGCLVDIKGPFIIDNADCILRTLLKLTSSNVAGLAMNGVPEKEWDERRDYMQWEEFNRLRDDELTYKEFIEFKYGKKWIDNEC